MIQATASPTPTSACGEEEQATGVERGERAGDHGRDGHSIEDEASAVVHEALALDDRDELAWDSEPPCDRRRGQRIGRRDDRSEDERASHERPSIAACATTATPTVVTTTSPIARRPIGRTLALRSRSDVKNAAP